MILIGCYSNKTQILWTVTHMVTKKGLDTFVLDWNNIAQNIFSRMSICFHVLLPMSWSWIWYQWLRTRYIAIFVYVGVNISITVRNRHFQKNCWCITINTFYWYPSVKFLGLLRAIVFSTQYHINIRSMNKFGLDNIYYHAKCIFILEFIKIKPFRSEKRHDLATLKLGCGHIWR